MYPEEVALRRPVSQNRMLSASSRHTMSAKAAALADHGTIYDPATRDEFVSHALFVKLRKGYGANPAAEAALLASSAGLPAASTSTLPYIGAADDAQVKARLRTLQGAKAARVAAAQDELRRMVELYYIPDITPAEAAARLRRLPEIEIADPIPVPHLLGPPTLPNDPLVEQQITMLSHVMLPEAWELWKGDTTMVIGVVDASIENTHEDLAPNIALNTKEMGLDAHGNDKRFNHIDDDDNGVVDDWHGANLAWQDDGSTPGETSIEGDDHGTKVAGLAAAATNNGIGIAGTAYRCRFFPVKAARSDGRLVYSYDGIAYCAQRGFKVINCSFGSNSYSQFLQDMITNLVIVHDCAIVAAAGNGVLYEAQFPAAYKHVLGVGSVDNDDIFKTTWGEQVGVSAPTGMSTIINNGYYPLAPATSFSAPVVAGVLALIRSHDTTLTADQAIAHLRLTADPVPIPRADSINPPVPSMYRLTGYGRVNAFRALSIAPRSHPAILLDSVWITDESGHAQERIPVGGRGRIRLRLKNILGDAANVKVRAILYTDDSTAIAIDSVRIPAGDIRGGEAKTLADGIPFEVKLPNSNRVRIRFDITADGGYDDFQFERVLIYLPYTTVHTPKLAFSLTDMGRFGYEDYPNNTVGDGFRFDGAPFLYEGGLIIASDQTRVLSNVRGGFPSMQQNDFGTVEYPTALNNYTLTLSDSSAGVNRIGLQIRMRLVTVDTIANAVGVEVRTRNMTSSTIDSLRVAMFMDWDLDSNADRQEVHLVETPGKAVPYYGSATSSSGYHLTHGVAGPVAHPIFYAIRNDTLPLLLYKGFGTDKKWFTVSNGIGSRSAGPTDSSDISLVIGKNATGLAPGMEDTTLFVIGVSPILSSAADAMQHLAFPGGPIASVDEGENSRSALTITQPGEFSRVATISIGQVGRDASLRVYDAGGREVYDLSPQLARSGTPATIIFDGTSLPSGTYYIQLISSAGAESRRILLLR
jgi:subtilisin family serine protease